MTCPVWCILGVGSSSHGREQTVVELFTGSSDSPLVC